MDSDLAAQRTRGVAALFDRVADTYDTVDVPWFTPIARRLVHEVGPRPGERALDIGSGRGAATFPLVEAVGPTGRVTAVDVSPRMVRALADDAAARGIDTLDLHVMDAAAPDLPAGGFDLAVASLVVFFLPDPARGLRAWRELLREGGRLGISTFGARDAAWQGLDDVFTPHLPPQLLDARTSGAAGPFASDGGVESLLRESGYCRVRTTGFTLDVTFDGAASWEDWSRSHGQRAMWESVPDAHLATVRAEAARQLEPARTPDGRFTLAQQVRITLGDRPER